MMTTHTTLKTGGDPRTLPDYANLRDELSKLTHPARPDVNWQYVERRCLSLFEQNGVELQTAAWYTLARTHLSGLAGLNEGLSILETLISHQWDVFWPKTLHARMEILSGLSQRLQQRMRMLPLNNSHLSELYRAEALLTRLSAVLQRVELKHLSQFDTLQTMIRSNAERLEKSNDASDLNALMLPDRELPHERAEPIDEVKWVYVVQPENQPNAEGLTTAHGAVRPWKPFVAGMCSMLVVCVAVAWGGGFLSRPDPLTTQAIASLAPLPEVLTPVQQDALTQRGTLPSTFISDTQQQLTRLDKLSPDWNISYSLQLLKQLQTLRPEEAKALIIQWQKKFNATALPVDAMNSWYQGMMTLQQLSDRLSSLDEQKGKYISVSELKSVVFSTMQSFNHAIPAEEQLRRLSQYPAGSALPEAEKTQLELHLKQLATRYAQIKQNAFVQ
ncbi:MULTISPECIES: VasL domain-containing protein [unclassified Enterobacter cloacae complex]|uniref:VasL domain-containing protein n=1 Tax=unclassified Enterobacter cloacae complex TaxID=2757714 RepID=UPI001872D9DF|nr:MULTISPECIES: VasL domain-containing protein [unclassified Enterobacter cloacae complex]MBE4812445.1 type VI secretion system ImpA family N-terminal domain-containing protein [Enterobacter cloacae complex sp. P44RS]MBE4829866.1 type VI secretion system ImpA family N-terminal domain-containing protein [Enterobacter cloacae complex sp. P42RS]MBE4838008.1 type VI secretion system ImpA family N-terminal domain-containing protein [Enterobacter cloacae complex sp. P46RS]MBE4843477.1 type VI secret